VTVDQEVDVAIIIEITRGNITKWVSWSGIEHGRGRGIDKNRISRRVVGGTTR
jgi:hypothetical protein